jgi:hypothetical protein
VRHPELAEPWTWRCLRNAEAGTHLVLRERDDDERTPHVGAGDGGLVLAEILRVGLPCLDGPELVGDPVRGARPELMEPRQQAWELPTRSTPTAVDSSTSSTIPFRIRMSPEIPRSSSTSEYHDP